MSFSILYRDIRKVVNDRKVRLNGSTISGANIQSVGGTYAQVTIRQPFLPSTTVIVHRVQDDGKTVTLKAVDGNDLVLTRV